MDGVIPPDILKWAQKMRDVFGPGVRLRRGVKWPGGNDTEDAKLKYNKAVNRNNRRTK